MYDYHCEIPLSNSRVLCIGPITRKEAEGVDCPFCDGQGTYLFLANADDVTQEIDIIARIVSDDAIERLAAALRLRLDQSAR